MYDMKTHDNVQKKRINNIQRQWLNGRQKEKKAKKSRVKNARIVETKIMTLHDDNAPPYLTLSIR